MSFDNIPNQLSAFWAGLGAKQRILLLGGAALTLAVLATFTVLLGKPDYKLLVTGMEPADAQQLTARLASKNIRYETSPDGKIINVPADQLDAARLEVAAGALKSGRMGFELFDKMNWGQSEFDEKVNYQRALEGELERTIQTLRDVESVRVHVVLAADSLFIDRAQQAKASVIIKTRSALSRERQAAIAQLVAGSVEKLSPDDVTIIDADSQRPMPGNQNHAVLGNQDIQNEIASRLVSTLEPVVGPEHLRASVSVEFDPTSAEETRDSYDPNSAVALSTQRSEESMGGIAAGGVPGTASNLPAAKPAVTAAASQNTQSSKTESSTYAVNRTSRRTVQPAGRLRRITAALLIDDAAETKQENGRRVDSRRHRTSEELQQFEQLAKAAIGFDAARGDSLVVQNISFAQVAVDVPPPPSPARRVQQSLRDWSTAIRYALLLLLFFLIYVLLLRPIKRQLVAAVRPSENALPKPPPVKKLEKPVTLPDLPIQATALIKQHVTDKIAAEPLASSQLVRAWLQEEQ